MKDIKSYVIGFLTCACLFLIMGQTNKTIGDIMDNKQIGRFQSSSVMQDNWIYITTIDTKSGMLQGRLKMKSKNYEGY